MVALDNFEIEYCLNSNALRKWQLVKIYFCILNVLTHLRIFRANDGLW